jgi:hypothetical protein
MGPAPMMRMVEMSVRLGIKSHGRVNWAQKKGAHAARPLSQERDQQMWKPVLRSIALPTI